MTKSGVLDAPVYTPHSIFKTRWNLWKLLRLKKEKTLTNWNSRLFANLKASYLRTQLLRWPWHTGYKDLLLYDDDFCVIVFIIVTYVYLYIR